MLVRALILRGDAWTPDVELRLCRFCLMSLTRCLAAHWEVCALKAMGLAVTSGWITAARTLITSRAGCVKLL